MKHYIIEEPVPCTYTKSRTELAGHQGAFHIEIFYMTSICSDEYGYFIKLTPHVGDNFCVEHWIRAGSNSFAPLEDIIESDKLSVAQKLRNIIKFVLGEMGPETTIELFLSVYTAGKFSGKKDLQKRFRQLMAEDDAT